MNSSNLNITRRKAFLGGACLFLPLPAFGHHSGALPISQVSFPLRGDIGSGSEATITNIRTQDQKLALTFDDGPHPTYTPLLLDVLASRKVRATFYVVGRAAEYSPQIIRRILDEGHELGNHSWSHPNFTGWETAEILTEVDRTNEVLFKASGVMPNTFRPPYGAFSFEQRFKLYQDRGLPTVLWSVDPEDWKHPGQQAITECVITEAQPGSIVLSHDIHFDTIRSVPGTIDALVELGFSFATVSELAEL